MSADMPQAAAGAAAQTVDAPGLLDGHGPLAFRHDECGSPIHVRVQCEQGHDVELQDVAVGRPR